MRARIEGLLLLLLNSACNYLLAQLPKDAAPLSNLPFANSVTIDGEGCLYTHVSTCYMHFDRPLAEQC